MSQISVVASLSLAVVEQGTRAPSPIASIPVSRLQSPQSARRQEPVQRTPVSAGYPATQPQSSISRSAAVSQRFGASGPQLGGAQPVKRTREGLASTPASSSAASSSLGQMGRTLTQGLRPLLVAQRPVSSTPGTRIGGAHSNGALRTPGASAPSGGGGPTPRTLSLRGSKPQPSLTVRPSNQPTFKKLRPE